MALSKDEIQLLKEMIADDSISKQEKDMYREMLGETPATSSKPAKKKATKKKSTPKKKKVSESDIDKMKAQIKQRTGKTEEECEKIVEEYRALRKKATTRKKKETATKEKSKKRTTKLKKEGKVIEGTTEKNVEATIDTATKTATKKVDKEITKIEKSTKGEKQVEKKIDQLVKKALASSKKFVSDMAKELSTKSKTDGKTYLLGLRSQIDALLKKYELGGEVFDGSGDSINFGSGGFTSSYNIQDGMISVGNNVKFDRGGSIQTRAKKLAKKDGKDLDKVSDKEYMKYRMIAQQEVGKNYAKGGTTENMYSITYNEAYGEKVWAEVPATSKKEAIEKLKKEGGVERIVSVRKMDNDEYAKGGLVIEEVRFGKESEDLEDYLDNNSWEVIEKEFEDKGTKFTLSMKDVEYEQRVDLEDYLDNKDLKYKDNSFAKGGMSQGYNDRLDESLGSRRGTAMSHHQNYKDRRDESKGMETGMGRRAYRGVDTMDNN